MSTEKKYEPREFSITGTVRAPESVGAEQLAESLKRGLEQSISGATVDLGEQAEPEWVVGQQVSGTDYERLPVGTRLQGLTQSDSYFTKVASGNAWAYTDSVGNTDSSAALDVDGPARTITHLPTATQPEDATEPFGWVNPENTRLRLNPDESRTEVYLGAPVPGEVAVWLTHDSGLAIEPLAKWETPIDKVMPAEDATDAYVEPEPLKVGDWVQVWARVDNPEPDYDGDIALRVVRRGESTGDGEATAWAHPDALVRPAAGQVPPWVKPARCTSLRAVSTNKDPILARCVFDAGDGHNHRDKNNMRWTTAEESGRITEGGAS